MGYNEYNEYIEYFIIIYLYRVHLVSESDTKKAEIAPGKNQVNRLKNLVHT